MEIKWMGHSAFIITAENGKVVLTDPYEPNCYDGALRYAPITVVADVVTASHTHADHYTRKLSGNPKVIIQKGSYEINGIKIKGIETYHDTTQGKERGNNIVYIYDIDGVRIVHLGDLGHFLSKKEVDTMGEIDVLLIPVGGHFTIDANSATGLAEMLKPAVTIPMHYKTEVLDFPIAGVDDFIKEKKGVKKLTSAEVTVTKETLPSEPEVWVLQYTK